MLVGRKSEETWLPFCLPLFDSEASTVLTRVWPVRIVASDGRHVLAVSLTSYLGMYRCISLASEPMFENAYFWEGRERAHRDRCYCSFFERMLTRKGHDVCVVRTESFILSLDDVMIT